ncbi:hypothetical protein JMJ77_0008711, partial [Colletotrichum scovillei]
LVQVIEKYKRETLQLPKASDARGFGSDMIRRNNALIGRGPGALLGSLTVHSNEPLVGERSAPVD